GGGGASGCGAGAVVGVVVVGRGAAPAGVTESPIAVPALVAATASTTAMPRIRRFDRVETGYAL
ncbi:MAG: hypothetical protein QOE62_1710, partial [Actinomycetota bacterium]|nr:hypothetical protein [Actinomycetota bacterium]